MAIKINPKGRNEMEALDITPERCQELCKGIETTGQRMSEANSSITFGEVLEQSIVEHSNNDNETAFMLGVFMRHTALHEVFKSFTGGLVFSAS